MLFNLKTDGAEWRFKFKFSNAIRSNYFSMLQLIKIIILQRLTEIKETYLCIANSLSISNFSINLCNMIILISFII